MKVPYQAARAKYQALADPYNYAVRPADQAELMHDLDVAHVLELEADIKFIKQAVRKMLTFRAKEDRDLSCWTKAVEVLLESCALELHAGDMEA